MAFLRRFRLFLVLAVFLGLSSAASPQVRLPFFRIWPHLAVKPRRTVVSPTVFCYRPVSLCLQNAPPPLSSSGDVLLAGASAATTTATTAETTTTTTNTTTVAPSSVDDSVTVALFPSDEEEEEEGEVDAGDIPSSSPPDPRSVVFLHSPLRARVSGRSPSPAPARGRSSLSDGKSRVTSGRWKGAVKNEEGFVRAQKQGPSSSPRPARTSRHTEIIVVEDDSESEAEERAAPRGRRKASGDFGDEEAELASAAESSGDDRAPRPMLAARTRVARMGTNQPTSLSPNWAGRARAP